MNKSLPHPTLVGQHTRQSCEPPGDAFLATRLVHQHEPVAKQRPGPRIVALQPMRQPNML